MPETATTLQTKQLLTYPEVAQIFACTRQHVYSLVKRGQLDAIKIDKMSRITGASVDRLIAESRVES